MKYEFLPLVLGLISMIAVIPEASAQTAYQSQGATGLFGRSSYYTNNMGRKDLPSPVHAVVPVRNWAPSLYQFGLSRGDMTGRGSLSSTAGGPVRANPAQTQPHNSASSFGFSTP